MEHTARWSRRDIRGVFGGARETRILAAGQPIQQIGPDGTFGELAIVDAEPRALSAVAIEDSEIAIAGS